MSADSDVTGFCEFKYERSVYEASLSDIGGAHDLMRQREGKVTLFVNVTGDCGNAPQFAILESLHKEFSARDFSVVAIPTNDYCGKDITYGEFEGGLRNAVMAEDFARSKYGVTFPFAVMTVSRGDRGDETDGRVADPVYQALNPLGEEAPIYGNFEKFIVSKDGKRSYRWHNGALLSFAHGEGICAPPDIVYDKMRSQISALLDE